MHADALGSALILAGLLGTGAVTQAHAQAPGSALEAQAESRVQAAAAALSRALVGRRLFAASGQAVGRVTSVVVGPDGNGLVAIVAVRPRFGWGRIAVAARLLQQAQGGAPRPPADSASATRATLESAPTLM